MKKINLPDKICIGCGKTFGQKSCRSISDYREKKYCSHSCAQNSHRGENHHLYRPLIERFNENIVIQENGCWKWIGYYRCNGRNGKYGGLKISGKSELAHRISYKLHNGEIPEGLFVLHKCDTPECVNPNHLFLGTNADNMKDMAMKHRGTEGIKAYHGKLQEADVIKIRGMKGTKFHKDIAKQFHVSTPTVTSILNKKSWKHIL